MAEFPVSTPKGKKRIIEQQKNPNPFLTQWYQLSKARVKKSLENNGSLDPVMDGITELMGRKPEKKRQLIDRDVSIQALTRYINFQLPKVFKELDYSIVKTRNKATYIENVKVTVAPDVIVKAQIDGKTVYGAIKIHISKNKPFSLQQSKIVATCVEEYLNNEIAEEGAVVRADLCYSYDIFAERMVSAHYSSRKSILRDIYSICDELKMIWDAA